jgi:hypothetical protein
MTDAITATNSSIAQQRTSIVTSRRPCCCFARLERAKLTEATRISATRSSSEGFRSSLSLLAAIQATRAADSGPSSFYLLLNMPASDTTGQALFEHPPFRQDWADIIQRDTARRARPQARCRQRCQVTRSFRTHFARVASST